MPKRKKRKADGKTVQITSTCDTHGRELVLRTIMRLFVHTQSGAVEKSI